VIVPCVLNGDFPINLPDYRANQPHWNREDGWEKSRLRAIHERIGPDDVVYECGAEEAEMAALFQMWGAKVVLIEPQRLVWPNMKAIWDANDLADPLASFVGFASTVTEPLDESVYLGWPPYADGEVTGTNHGFIELYNSADVNAQIRLDDLVNIGAIPTMLSIDVEGSEWQVLKGAERILREHRPTIFLSLHPEYMFHQWGQYSRDLRGWLEDIGYRETLLEYSHECHLMYEAL
jgi:FkbM family methyltransferase